MPDPVTLMIKKEGDQFCLYTQDGSRKLGCHPTEEEAKRQEAIIKARQAEAAAIRGTAVQISLADISADAGDAQVLPNGDVLKWIPLADAGEKWVNGPHQFDMTPALIDQGIANWKADGSNPIVVTIGHTFDAASPAAAWIENLERRDDGRPWGLVHFLADTWSRIEKGEFKYFSLEFYKSTVDRQGKEIGFVFDGGAILNKPFFAIRIDQSRHPGASPCFALSQFGTNPSTTPVPSQGRGAADGNDGGSPMADPTPNPAPAKPADTQPVIAGDKVTLSRAQFDALIALRSENDQLKLKNSELTSKSESNEGRIATLERGRTADRIRAAIVKLQGQGVVLQLGDFAIESSEADALAWLATQPYGVSTVEGLEKLAKDQDATAHLPRVKLGGERSGGGISNIVPVDLSTEAGRNSAVQNHMAHIRRTYSKADLELSLARRKQTLEQFAREDLAADHPQYRKELVTGK